MTEFELHIDESGSFEISQDETGPPVRLVLGVLVHKEEAERNRQRLVRAMEPLLAKYFPWRDKITGIHASSLGDDEKWRVKSKFQELFKSVESARICVIHDGQRLEADAAPRGAHLYRNMLLQLLRTTVYFHPGLPEDAHFDIRLAHRRFTYPYAHDKGLAAQGYLKLREEGGKTSFTAITDADLLSILHHLRDAVRLKTDRGATYRMKPFAEWNDPYMVMADMIANSGYGIMLREQGKGPGAIAKEFSRQFGARSLLYVAPADYDFPEELLIQFHRGDRAGFLRDYHRLSRSRSKETATTDRLLLEPAVDRALEDIASHDSSLDLCATIVDFVDDIYEKRSHGLYGKVPDMLEAVGPAVERAALDPQWGRVAYSYYNSRLRRANHTGDIEGGGKAGARACEIFALLEGKTLEEVRGHHECINRLSVCDTNEFAFQRALNRLEPIKQREEQLNQYLGNPKNRILGTIYGSMGQNKAFLGENEAALELFRIADRHLGPDDPMQLSFMAHVAVSTRDQQLYKDCIVKLFKRGSGLASFPGFEPYVRICLDNLDDHGFNLHLLLKGMGAFGAADQQALLRAVAKAVKVPPRTQHPWGLLYAVLARLLSMAPASESDARTYWKMAREFSAGGAHAITLVLLGHAARAAEAVFLLQKGSEQEARSLAREILASFDGPHGRALPAGIYNPERAKGDQAGWFDEEAQRIADDLRNAKGDLMGDVDRFSRRLTFNYR